MDLFDVAALAIGGILSTVAWANSYGEDTLNSAGAVVHNSIQSNAWLAPIFLAAFLLDFLMILPAVFIIFATAFKRRNKGL